MAAYYPTSSTTTTTYDPKPSLPYTIMDRQIIEDHDLCEYLVINNSINVRFEQAANTELLKSFEVLFNGNHVSAILENTDDLERGKPTCRWTVVCDIPMFPDSNDNIRVRVPLSRSHGTLMFQREAYEEVSLAYRDIYNKFQEHRDKDKSRGDESGTAEREILFLKTNCTIILNVTQGKIDDFTMGEPIADSDFILPARLTNALDSIPNALQALEKTINTLGNAHPLAKAVLTALSIPYKLLKNAQEFKKNINDLADAMRTTSKCLLDARRRTKIASARETFVSIMKTLRDAALFLNRYLEENWFRRIIRAQFPKKLEMFAEDLIKTKNSFQMAMIMQIARDVDPSITQDDFLRKRLDPAKLQPLEEGCLNGTRVNILDKVRTWLQDESAQNILWIKGAPGAGKTTVATTIAKELANVTPFCAKFFCKRDVPDLRNPRQIWRTLAYNLADKHDGVKAALMSTLDQKKGDAQDYSVIEQFHQFIEGPLQKDLKETSFRLYKDPYPFVIIDGLDECFSADDTNWDPLLESLVLWTKLPAVFKLIVTSRDFLDIRHALGTTSRLVDLTTGDSVSEDSANDVHKFFGNKFELVRKNHPGIRARFKWPDDAQLRELSGYAAGLFIWAQMVVKFVGMRAVGSNPIKRLEDVLSDIRASSGSSRGAATATDGMGQVDRLYARIVFEAFYRSTPDEQERVKKLLAAILLAKEPLSKSDLVQLMSESTDTSDLNHDLVSIESALHELSPIIPLSETDGKLRVCHKTVSDCLLSRDRCTTAMKFVAQQWNMRAPDVHFSGNYESFILDVQVENRHLALACLRLASRSLLKDICNVALLLQLSSGPLCYARRHWLGHLEDAGGNYTAVLPNVKNLAKAVEFAYGCLVRYKDKLTLAKGAAIALTNALRRAVGFARQCISQEQTAVDNFEPNINQYAKDLDISRGNFQIAMVVNLAEDVDESALDAPDAFLRKRLCPPDQTPLDNECLKGTRTSIFRRAKNWLEDPDQQNILWIVGAPGTGKSAIAASLVSEFSKSRLCAKAFVKRDYEDRSDPSRVWGTLAYDLATSHVGLKGNIMEALLEKSQHPENAAKNQSHFPDIIIEALQEQQCLSVVFIIDALDECFTEDNAQWRALMQTLRGWADLPGSFKLVVTSRDISEIRSALADVSSCISLKAESDDSIREAQSDMKIFFQAKFEEMLEVSEDARSYWIQVEVIHRLIDYAAGSFIFAKMVVELVKLNPHSHVDNILNGNELGNDKNIDALYAKILVDVLGQLYEKEREDFRTVLAFIVLAKSPFREADIVDLLSSTIFSEDEAQQLVACVVKELSAIISVGDNQLLRIPHKSFSDFLLNHKRSFAAMKYFFPHQDAHSYLVNREKDSANIAIACLQFMNRSLKFNACAIATSHSLNNDIPALSTLISGSISTLLVYACRFWGEHLKSLDYDGLNLQRLLSPLKTLLRENLLYWLEILSLAKEVPLAKRSLKIAVAVLEGQNNELAGVLVAKDALLFVDMFETPIAAAVPHIYISALPFCPLDSLIAQIYGPYYSSTLSVVKGRRINWDIAAVTSKSSAHKEDVLSVAFFPDGKKLASGSQDGTVRVWDSETGRELDASLIGHKNWVRSISVSPDGSRIASGDNYGRLQIWDSHMGACPLESIEAHSGCIWSVAFSPDGSRIITGSKDKTVKVWSLAIGHLCLGPLMGHTGDVNSVTFSHDGTTIASGSDDVTIRIWDARTGESHREPLTRHTRAILSIAFSANGCYLASGSDDASVRLWDVLQGFSPMRTITVRDAVWSVMFSPDSSCLVSGCADGGLRFWDVNSQAGGRQKIGEVVHGHTGGVQSVTFTPDGLSVASGGNDHSIKIWKVPPTSTRSPGTAAGLKREGNTNAVNSDPKYLDSRGFPVLDDRSFIDNDGWMRTSRRDGAKVLFWVPRENRDGLWWPRNTAVIHETVTKIDFRQFVHGESWMECRTDSDSEIE